MKLRNRFVSPLSEMGEDEHPSITPTSKGRGQSEMEAELANEVTPSTTVVDCDCEQYEEASIYDWYVTCTTEFACTECLQKSIAEP